MQQFQSLWGLVNYYSCPRFNSEEFQLVFRCNGIKGYRIALYHPATNDATEWCVQTLKKAITAGRRDKMSDQHKLSNFLWKCRSTANAIIRVPQASYFSIVSLSHTNCTRSPKTKQWKANIGETVSRNQLMMSAVTREIYRF